VKEFEKEGIKLNEYQNPNENDARKINYNNNQELNFVVGLIASLRKQLKNFSPILYYLSRETCM